MNFNIRIPGYIHKDLCQIKLTIQKEYRKDYPSLQNIANAAFEKFIEDWQNPELQPQLKSELIKRRQITKLRQGNHSHNKSQAN